MRQLAVLGFRAKRGPGSSDLLKRRAFILCVGFSLVLCSLAKAQFLLSPEEEQKANYAFDHGVATGRLACTVEPRNPFLDFAFRFDVGYILRCPLREFAGQESITYTLVRVTPEGGAPVVFGDAYKLPKIPAEMRSPTTLRKMKNEVETSGGFSVGEGRYLVDVLVVDKGTSRTLRKRWKVKVARTRGERTVPLAIRANGIAPMIFHPWDGPHGGQRGLRLTVLLDASPINPWAFKLRAWDRAFLLGSLSSLLRQIPCQSVRLVAFNLDQQREIAREDPFDGPAFTRLSQALRKLEPGIVSVNALRQQGSFKLLAALTNQELIAAEPVDAVIFLGPRARYENKIPPGILKPRETAIPRFFYFKYFPYVRADFPDAVHHLTKAVGGTVYEFRSPGELAQGVRKMLGKLGRSGDETAEAPGAQDK
jgi:hypothetical protein